MKCLGLVSADCLDQAAHCFGLPVGLSFVGRAWSDAKLLALAADFEATTKARREPRFLPTAEVK